MFPFSLLADGMTWYPVLFDSPLNIARGVAFWLTVALALGFAAGAILLKDEKRKKFIKYCAISAVCYACAVAMVFLVWTFAEDGIVPMLFVPLLILLITVAAGSAVLFFNRSKPVVIVLGCIAGAAAIATLVCFGVYGAGQEDSGITAQDNALLYVSAAALTGLIVLFAFLFGRKDKKGFDSKSLTYAGVCIAMSFALSYVRFFKLPQGGSVTLASLLPLMIYSYMFGTRKGVFAGLIYGVLQAVQDPYIIHPAQFLLDYPIAFAAIGISGMFATARKLDKLPQVQFALGAIVGSVFRYLSHLFSGVFAFADLGADPAGAWIYSLSYNSFVFVDIAIAIAAGIILFSSKAFVKQARKFRPAEQPAEENLS